MGKKGKIIKLKRDQKAKLKSEIKALKTELHEAIIAVANSNLIKNLPENVILRDNPSKIKYSEVLISFVKPWFEKELDLSSIKTPVSNGNISLE